MSPLINKPIKNIKSFVRSIQIIHLAMTLGLLLFIGFTWSKLSTLEMAHFSTKIVAYIFPVFFIVIIGLGNFLKKRILTTVKKKEKLSEKLQLFQTAHIIETASVEGIGFASTALYMVFENVIFLGLALLAIAVLSLRFPTTDRIAQSIGLSIEEQAYFNDPQRPLP